MNMDCCIRTSIGLCLLAAASIAGAQDVPQQAAPPPPQSAQPTQPAASPPPPQYSTPGQPTTAPLPRLPSQQQNQQAQPSPPPQQYQYRYAPPAPPPGAVPPPQQWTHSDSRYPNDGSGSGFQYRPFRFHVDGGGTITQNANDTMLDNGWNVGAGFSFFPSSHVPLGLRVDGTYNHFNMRQNLLNEASAYYGTTVDHGTEQMYGGDVDLELDLPLSQTTKFYLLAGGGWYKQRDTFRQTNFYPGIVCVWYGCGPGYYGDRSIVGRSTSDWHFAKNAGFGFEFAMSPWTSFFAEARYMRVNPDDAKSDYIPIRVGLRF
jgi:hypothetical protein